MLTLQALVEELGLELASGPRDGATPVRSVHSTELLDPTPWLSGGELLLTTGLRLGDEPTQRAFVARLVDHGIAGLGLGVGFDHAEIPSALLAAARAADFPVFAVPYEVPFIAITERAFAQLVNDRYADLRRSSAIQAELERLVLDGRGLGAVVDRVASEVTPDVLVVTPRGEVLASSLPAVDVARLEAILATLPEGSPAVFALPVAQGERSSGAWLIGLTGPDGPGDLDRLILQQTATVVALELMRRRVAQDTERRLAGDALAEALTGRLDPAELEARLRPFGVGTHAAVLVFSLEDPAAATPALEQALGRVGVGGLVAVRAGLVCAVLDGAGLEPLTVAARVRRELEQDVGPVRAAVSRVGPVGGLRHSFHEARCALEAVRLHNGRAPEVASYTDLGAFELLLSLQDDDALRAYCDRVLGTIEEDDPEYGSELLRSLECFIEHNGHWEPAARDLFCHRHTLRYRIRRVEELTGRDLSSARDRIELWLALRGRELVR